MCKYTYKHTYRERDREIVYAYVYIISSPSSRLWKKDASTLT